MRKYYIHNNVIESSVCKKMREGSLIGVESAALVRDAQGERIQDNGKHHAFRLQPSVFLTSRFCSAINSLLPIISSDFQLRLAVRDGPKFVKYVQGSHFDWHIDEHPVSPTRHLVTALLFLDTEGEEHVGGSIQLQLKNNIAISVPAKVGSVLVFRSNLLHRVKPVIWGKRCVAIFWLGSSRCVV